MEIIFNKIIPKLMLFLSILMNICFDPKLEGQELGVIGLGRHG